MNDNEFEEITEPIAKTIETMDYYYLETDKTRITEVLKILSSQFPIPEEHKHLKRVDHHKENKDILKVLICEKTEERPMSSILSILSSISTSIYITSVPRYPAFIKEHFQQGRALWPITYHPQTPPPTLTKEEKEKYKGIMQQAIKLAQQAKEEGNAPVAMILVDKEGKIVGQSGDNRKEMFLDHCCFAGIQHRSKQLKEQMINKRPSKDDPYLCTDCDVIITREPCVMCCMCLLHSRIRYVIYGCDDINGGFSQQIHIHYNKKLNHHFRVFRNVCKEECEELWNSYSLKQSSYV